MKKNNKNTTRVRLARGKKPKFNFSFDRRDDSRDNSKSSITRKQPRNKE